MLIYGINPMVEAAKNEIYPEMFYLQKGKDKNPRVKELITLLERGGVKPSYLTNLNKICPQQAVHQGVAGDYRHRFIWPVRDLPQDCEKIVMLDGISDPHNFGAALRVCECFGINNVIYFDGDSSGLTSVAVKSSAGAAFQVSLYEGNLNKAIQFLKERDFSIYALAGEGEQSIYDLKPKGKFCFVIGSEGKGVRFNICRQADDLVHIPMQGALNSLNVSCALSAALAVVNQP
ncbi:MAG: RNA methyltransferase [Lentisphaeria bacterium]|nr:RNA methyltransferase [Lentisphaeria bacterium]